MATETQPSASETVLKLIELAEHIILQLPECNILTVASTVSRTWAQIVKTSPAIRQKLFSPTPGGSSLVSPIYFCRSSWHQENCFPVYARDFIINPAFEYATEDEILPRLRRSATDPKRIWMLVCLTLHDSTRSNCHLDKLSTWRGMFLTKPPCTTMFVESRMVATDTNGADAQERHRLLSPAYLHQRNGITVGFIDGCSCGDGFITLRIGTSTKSNSGDSYAIVRVKVGDKEICIVKHRRRRNPCLGSSYATYRATILWQHEAYRSPHSDKSSFLL